MYDVFRFLAGAPVPSIEATAIDPGTLPYLRTDNFAATLRYADGSLGTLTYTALGPKTGLGKEHIEVFCDGEAYVVRRLQAPDAGERRLGAVAGRGRQGPPRGARAGSPTRSPTGGAAPDRLRRARRDDGRGRSGSRTTCTDAARTRSRVNAYILPDGPLEAAALIESDALAGTTRAPQGRRSPCPNGPRWPASTRRSRGGRRRRAS